MPAGYLGRRRGQCLLQPLAKHGRPQTFQQMRQTSAVGQPPGREGCLSKLGMACLVHEPCCGQNINLLAVPQPADKQWWRPSPVPVACSHSGAHSPLGRPFPPAVQLSIRPPHPLRRPALHGTRMPDTKKCEGRGCLPLPPGGGRRNVQSLPIVEGEAFSPTGQRSSAARPMHPVTLAHASSGRPESERVCSTAAGELRLHHERRQPCTHQ